jgi:chromosome segregation ATPase
MYDKIDKKEKEIKKLNEKISQLSLKINWCHEENKKYEKLIEKEESEGELLRHMLNFLTKNQWFFYFLVIN